jgi:epoxyqueuosine reductase
MVVNSCTSQIDMIKTEAHRLGFSLCGITKPNQPEHLATFNNWVQSGRNADMGYLATNTAFQDRANPNLLFPEGKAIIMLGIPYCSPNSLPFPTSERPMGRIASYAWGLDYHLILPTRMQTLRNYISAITSTDIRSRCFTDTAPILERDLAQSAGLGWIGKHTCLIAPKQGSTFFLSELFIDLELEPDFPFISDRCGTCSRCRDACPTKCIRDDRTLDAQRCISYLTIEKKGVISKELRPRMGNWVFGCDICQSVCPWNIRFSSLQEDSIFKPYPGIPFPDLINELSLTPMEFNHKYHNSPILRPHRRGYLRNVAIALGNSHNPMAVPALIDSLSLEPEPLVRGAAAWALREIGLPIALNCLRNASKMETDAYVLSEINDEKEFF